jgi:hypothetical protein
MSRILYPLTLLLTFSLLLAACGPLMADEEQRTMDGGQATFASPTNTYPTSAYPTTPRRVTPASSPLLINDDGVLYADSFLLAPFQQGGSSLLLNLQPLIAESGFQCGWDGWMTYDSLNEQQAWVQDGARYFSGQLPGGESRYEQKIYPQGRDVHFELTLDAGGEAEDIAWAEFVFYLPLAAFQNQRYLADGNEGLYPAEYGAGTLAENLSELQLLPNDPARSLTLHSPTGGISLADGRQWSSQMYMVAVRLPLDGSTLHFTLTPPPADPGPNPPAVRYSHAGYLPAGPKQAVLEIDWRDSFPSLAVRLERKSGSEAETVLTGEFVPVLQDFWKQFAVFDFSAVQESGEYRLVWAGGATEWFPIAPNVFENRWQNTLDFFFPFQMSHAAVDLGGGLAHEASTLDDAVAAPPYTDGADGFLSYEADGASGYVPLDVGGWFDAGDYDLNVAAQAFVVHQLALAWEEFAPQRDLHRLDLANRRLNVRQPNGIPDLLEQIEWGARWLLTMQAANGRVFVGVVESPDRYGETALPEDMTDGIPNTGDERWLFHDYHSDVNLKFVVATAAASRALRASNPQLAEQAWQAALLAWDYFRNHPEVYRETVYFSANAEGREQMISAAAIELYLTQPDPAYLQTLEQFTAYFEHLPTEWPASTIGSQQSNFWYVPSFLARLYPHLPDGTLKTSIRTALEDAADLLDQLSAPSPFPFMADWPYSDWGEVGTYVSGINEAYWLQKVLPDRIRLSDLFPAAYWVYGLHPVNDFTLVFGSGLPEPRYHYSSILHVRFGSAPASVPGAVVPGIATLTEARLLYYLDQPETYRNNEACIYDAASFLFAMLALEPPLPYSVHLPMVLR